MRELRWNEALSPRPLPLVAAPEVPREPRGLLRLVWWEDLVTLAILGMVFLAVIGSIDRAGWVDGMPSLYPIAALGLLMGMAMARLRWPEGFVHLLAAPIGAAAILAQLLAILPGERPADRFDVLVARMQDWFAAAFGGGINNDDLPFIVMVVTLSWLAAYLSSWAIFRWQNAWLGLIPGGIALLINISYLPGQFSFTFVVFLFGGALLVTRMHLLDRAKAWREGDMPYPPFLSLSVLHATFWLTLLLVGLAWMLPEANETDALQSVWRRTTAPVTERVEGLSRVFIGVHSKKPVRVHNFGSTLPFQGGIKLPDTPVLEVEVEAADQLPFLRAQIYDLYTSSGWKQQPRGTAMVAPQQALRSDEQLNLRESTAVQLESEGRTKDTLFSLGQPLQLDRDAIARLGSAGWDVTGLESNANLERGEGYQVTSSISAAPEDALRRASSDYPGWVLDRYLDLPRNFPPLVRDLAASIASDEPSAYDKAQAIERYLRGIPYDLRVPKTPPGRDTVEYFLFDAQRGYFDHHASTMVVMLRSVGIPARLAVGYALRPEERALPGDRFDVTERSAFAWPEVYFPGLGWVEFNPTPSLPPILRPGPQGISQTQGQYVAPGGAGDTSDVPPFAPEPEGSGAEQASGGVNRGLWITSALLAGFAALLLASAGALRFAWTRGLSGLDQPAQLWEKTVRLASWGRLPPRPTQTPREYARSLEEQVPGLRGVDVLAEGYVAHRFGVRSLDGPARARLEAAWRSVRGVLLRKLLRLRRTGN